MIKALRAHEFDTMLGTVRFDGKGNVQDFEPFVWYVWQDGGYVPLDPKPATE